MGIQMKLTVYGNNATCPEKDGACSSFLLEFGNKKILIDMGSGSSAKIQRDIDIKQLDAIIISHLHFDHVADLFCVKYMLETRKAKGEDIPTIPLYTPTLPKWASNELLTNDVFKHIKIKDNLIVSLFGATIIFKQMVHLIESYGIRVECEGKRFAYTGDTGIFPGILDLARGVDLFLSEATFPSCQSAEEGHHLSSASAATIAKNANVKKLLLTHYHSEDKEEILKEAKAIFANTELSVIGESLTF